MRSAFRICVGHVASPPRPYLHHAQPHPHDVRTILQPLAVRNASMLGIPLALSACVVLHTGSDRQVDLAITHASVLDVRSGRVLPETTVLIERGVITSVTRNAEGSSIRAARVLDAHGRLLTPGFTDVHLHTFLVLADSTPAGMASRALVMRPDSIAAYRREFAHAYLPYGVTLVRDVGTDEHYLPMLRGRP